MTRNERGAGPARMTHAQDGDIAVFLIGMTINKPWRPDLWVPVFTAMGPMLRELYVAKARALEGTEEDLGFLAARTTVGLRGPTVIQYWRSANDIYRYAGEADRRHRPAWQAFNRRARKAPGAVGVWHETFAVPAGAHESVYVDVPRPMGLADATGQVPVLRRGDRARDRMRAVA
jgi:hypothetical protein